MIRARHSLSGQVEAPLAFAREMLSAMRLAHPTRKPSDGPAEEKIRSFYNSWQWKRLRYRVLKERGRVCECCNATAAGGAKICVDHIKPLRHFWHLRLDPKNMQVLCDDCNRGKGSQDQTDWRDDERKAA